MSQFRKDRKTRRIYCDESSYTWQRYFVLGAIWHTADYNQVEQALFTTRERHHLIDEIKWVKAPRQKRGFFKAYQALIDTFIEHPIYFKALIIDTHKNPLKHPKYSLGDAELGYYKYYYQLLYSGLIQKNQLVNYLVKVDHRPNYKKGRIGDLQDCINRSAERDGFPDMAFGLSNCCIVEECNSKNEQCIQLADLLTGMVAARWNKSTTNEARLALIDYLNTRLGKDIGIPSSSNSEGKFNRWLFRSTNR